MGTHTYMYFIIETKLHWHGTENKFKLYHKGNHMQIELHTRFTQHDVCKTFFEQLV